MAATPAKQRGSKRGPARSGVRASAAPAVMPASMPPTKMALGDVAADRQPMGDRLGRRVVAGRQRPAVGRQLLGPRSFSYSHKAHARDQQQHAGHVDCADRFVQRDGSNNYRAASHSTALRRPAPQGAASGRFRQSQRPNHPWRQPSCSGKRAGGKRANRNAGVAEASLKVPFYPGPCR